MELDLWSGPQPVLSDGVITIGPWCHEDAAWIQETCRDPEIVRWSMVPGAEELDDAQRYVDEIVPEFFASGLGVQLAIGEASSGERLGAVGLLISDPENGVGEIGCYLSAPARGAGAATRAIGLLGTWALDVVRLERLELHILVGNEPSLRLAERCGYQLEGILRSRERRGEVRHDVALFSRLAPVEEVQSRGVR
jgi:RimJ/RimL family protein N-acetyltransferase